MYVFFFSETIDGKNLPLDDKLSDRDYLLLDYFSAANGAAETTILAGK